MSSKAQLGIRKTVEVKSMFRRNLEVFNPVRVLGSGKMIVPLHPHPADSGPSPPLCLPGLHQSLGESGPSFL